MLGKVDCQAVAKLRLDLRKGNCLAASLICSKALLLKQAHSISVVYACSYNSVLMTNSRSQSHAIKRQINSWRLNCPLPALSHVSHYYVSITVQGL